MYHILIEERNWSLLEGHKMWIWLRSHFYYYIDNYECVLSAFELSHGVMNLVLIVLLFRCLSLVKCVKMSAVVREVRAGTSFGIINGRQKTFEP
jgi:hypothetical protein